MKNHPSPTGNTAIDKAIDLHQSGQLQKADKAYQRILNKKPAHIDALHMRGVLKTEQGNYELAEHLLKKALKLGSDDPWIRFHYAQMLATKNHHDEAIVQYKKAIKSGATEADVYFTYANSLLECNHLPEAIENYHQALQLQPHDVECQLNLANACEATGDYKTALQYLQALATSHNNNHYKLQYAELLLTAGQARKAYATLCTINALGNTKEIDHALSTARAMQKKVRHDATAYLLELVKPHREKLTQNQLDLTVGLLNDLGHYQQSQEILKTQSESHDRSAWSWFQQGICEQVAGNFPAASECHYHALQLDNTLGAAAYSLATNGSINIEASTLQHWLTVKDDPEIKPEQQAQFAFAAARVLDQQQHYDDAFTCYSEANQLTASELPFDADRWDSYTDSIIETFCKDYFDRWRQYLASAHQPTDPGNQQLVFIVGMPRSGSTMLEQTLKNRAGVTGLGEHHAMRSIVADIPEVTGFINSAPHCANDLMPHHIDDFRQAYLTTVIEKTGIGLPQSTGSQSSVEFVVDKMLGNFVRLGIVALMFPNARILHSARNPMATGVSCFTNAFNNGLRFTYDLYAMGRAWQSYNRLMQHWHKVLPIPIMDVHYESMVSDTENYFQSVLDFLQIGHIQKNTQQTARGSDNIATASFWQARQAISNKSLNSWQRFDKHLNPLREGLEHQHNA